MFFYEVPGMIKINEKNDSGMSATKKALNSIKSCQFGMEI
jgi:hypothetical protein